MHLCFRSASCGILSDLGFQGPPRNFERISDSKKATDFLFWCFFLLFQLVSYLFPIFTFDISVICSKWNLKVVLRPRTVSGTLELRGAKYRRGRLVRWSRGIWCDMAKVSGTRTGCKDMQGIHGNRSIEL